MCIYIYSKIWVDISDISDIYMEHMIETQLREVFNKYGFFHGIGMSGHRGMGDLALYIYGEHCLSLGSG